MLNQTLADVLLILAGGLTIAAAIFNLVMACRNYRNAREILASARMLSAASQNFRDGAMQQQFLIEKMAGLDERLKVIEAQVLVRKRNDEANGPIRGNSGPSKRP